MRFKLYVNIEIIIIIIIIIIHFVGVFRNIFLLATAHPTLTMAREHISQNVAFWKGGKNETWP
jgi:hypothetical protein